MKFEPRWKPELPNLKGAELIGLDIETYDPHLKELGSGVRRGAYIIGLSVSIKRDGQYLSWYIPVGHNEGPNIEFDKFRLWAKEELTNEKQDKILTNALYDLDFLTHEKIKIAGRIHDIQVAEPLLDENAGRYNLEYLSKKYLGFGKYEEELNDYVKNLFGPKAETKANLWKLPSTIVRKYAEVDASNPLKIFEQQIKLIEEEELTEIYNIETDLIPILLKMKVEGVRVDKDRAHILEEKYKKQIKENEKRLKEIAGYNINYRASESIGTFCDRNSISYPLTQKTKKPSITKDWMERQDHEIFELILSLRQDYKLSGSFFEGAVLKYQINGRVHCQFNQLRSEEYGTVSGRFSSSLPNLQQIPSPEKTLGPLARSLFLPEEDEQWVCCDYKQIEPRLTLHYAKGPEAEKAREFLINHPNEDSYKPMLDATWEYLIKYFPEKLVRKKLKIIQLGLTYGQGKTSLVKKLGVSPREGNEIMKYFHELVPYVKSLSNDVKKVAERRGYVKTILGRRRRFDTFEPRGNYGEERFPALPYEEAINEYGTNIVRAYCYKALNSVIQGSSADMIKKAMVDIYKSGLLDHVKMLLTIHDELDFSVPKTQQGTECKKEIKHIMETTIPLKVPTKIDMEVGDNWGYIQKELQ